MVTARSAQRRTAVAAEVVGTVAAAAFGYSRHRSAGIVDSGHCRRLRIGGADTAGRVVGSDRSEPGCCCCCYHHKIPGHYSEFGHWNLLGLAGNQKSLLQGFP